MLMFGFSSYCLVVFPKHTVNTKPHMYGGLPCAPKPFGAAEYRHEKSHFQEFRGIIFIHSRSKSHVVTTCIISHQRQCTFLGLLPGYFTHGGEYVAFRQEASPSHDKKTHTHTRSCTPFLYLNLTKSKTKKRRNIAVRTPTTKLVKCASP